MNRVYKSKRGFTLVEIVIVVAIIVMLAAVVGISIHGYVANSRSASASLSTERRAFRSDNAAKDSAFVAYGFGYQAGSAT